MKFYKFASCLFFVSLWASIIASCSSNKEILLSHDGKNYTFNLRDLEAYLKKQYSCVLDIRVNEPEVINATDGNNALIIYNPHLIERDGKLSYYGTKLAFSISAKAWKTLEDNAHSHQFYRVMQAFKDALLTERVVSSFRTACSAGILFALYGMYNKPTSLAPKIGITILGAIIYFMHCIEVDSRFRHRSVLAEGTCPPSVFGFEKTGESNDPEPLVHVVTSYNINNIPHVITQIGGA